MLRLVALRRWHGGNAIDPEKGEAKTMFLYDLGEYFHLNRSGCFGGQIASLLSGIMNGGDAHVIPSSKQLFNFAQEGQAEQYVGTQSIDGVPCNHWRSEVSMGSTSMFLDYYFSVPEWSSPESGTSQVPVMLHLKGTSSRDGHPFEHYYTFGHFRAGPITHDHEFYVPASLTPCQGNVTSPAPTMEIDVGYCQDMCGDYNPVTRGMMQSPPALPALPDSFDTWITCNIVNKNYSVMVHEVYDGPGNRGLFSRFHSKYNSRDPERGRSRTMMLYDYGEFFHVNGSGCFGGQIAEMAGRGLPFVGRDTHVIPSTKEMFVFAQAGQDEVYLGMQTVDGVPCNLWRSEVRRGQMNMTIDYFFSVPEWDTPESNATQIPVQLRLKGVRPSRNTDPDHRVGGVYTFDHFYSFAFFKAGPITGFSDHEFYLPTTVRPCQGNVTMQPPWDEIGDNQGYCEANCKDYRPGDGAAYFGFVVLGAVLAVVVVFLSGLMFGRKIGAAMPIMKESKLDVQVPPMEMVSGPGAGPTPQA